MTGRAAPLFFFVDASCDTPHALPRSDVMGKYSSARGGHGRIGRWWWYFFFLMWFSSPLEDNQKRGEQKNIMPLAVNLNITYMRILFIISSLQELTKRSVLSSPHALQQTTNFRVAQKRRVLKTKMEGQLTMHTIRVQC